MYYVFSLLIFLIVWWVGSFVFPPDFVPSPMRVMAELSRNERYYALQFLHTAWISLAAVLAGTLIATISGSLAIYLRPTRRILETGALLSQTLPMVAVAPILVFILGFGSTTKITIATLISFAPLVASVLGGLSALPMSIFELSVLLNLTTNQRARYIELPHILLSIGPGLRVTSVLSVIGALIAEFVVQTNGLGAAILMARHSYNIDAMFAAMILAMLLGLAFVAVSTTVDIMLRRQIVPNRLRSI